MSKVLIAGGAGFIGSNLSRELLEKGDQVIVIDSLITGNKANIEELLSNPHFLFIEHDVIQPLDQIEDQLSSVEKIYDLASPASPNIQSPRSYMSFPIETLLTNSFGVYHLVSLAKKINARILYSSTSEVYGDPAVSPQTEEYWGNVNPNGVRSVYDEGKRFGEAMMMAFHRKFGVDVRIVRIFNTYGPWMQKDDGRVVSNFINQALENKPLTIYGDGSQTRSFCYVSDLVKGLQLAMDTEGQNGIVVNLGNPNELPIREIAHKIKELTGSTSEIIHEDLPEDDPKQRQPDITKARTILGFEPQISLEEGLKKTIEYFKGV